MDSIVAAWAIEVGIIAVKRLGGDVPAGDGFRRRLPYPWELLSSAVVFGLLVALGQSDTARKPATALAWGLVVATLLNGELAKTSGTNPALGALTSVSNFLSGKYGVPGLNAQMSGLVGTAPPATGPGSGDTGNILNQVRR